MEPGLVEGRFHQCMCLLRVVTGEVQITKNILLLEVPIYIPVRQQPSEAREVSHT
jgi:hypothetical protein